MSDETKDPAVPAQKPKTQLGIKETSELVEFVTELGIVLSDTLGDGFQTDDLLMMLPLASKGMTAIKGSNLILAEMGDLDEQEAAQILDLVERRIAGRLPNVGDRARKIAGAAWRLIPPLIDLVAAVKD